MHHLAAEADPDPDAVVETIDVSNFSGSQTIDVTQINGITVDNFALIHWSTEDLLYAGGGQNPQFGIRLSTDGGSSFLTTGYSGQVYLGTVNVSALTEQMGVADSTPTSPYLSGFLMHLNSATARTISKAFNARGTSATLDGAYAVSRHDTAAIHDAIQFRVRSDNSNVKFSSGFIHLTGYRMPAARINVQTFDLATTPVANVVYNVPDGHTMVSAIFTGVTKSASTAMLCRVGKDGVLLSGASDYNSSRFASSGGVQNENRASWLLGSAATAASVGVVDFLNINTLAPVIVDAHLQQAVLSFQAGGVLNSASQKNNTISIGTFGAQTLNAGTVTFISYKVRTEVTSITANSGTTTQSLGTNIKKAPMIALASHDLTMSGAATLGLQTGIGGVFDTTSGDYRFMRHAQNDRQVGNTETSARWGDGVPATHNIGTMLLGMTENQFAANLWAWDGETTPTATRIGSLRDDDKSNDSLRSISTATHTSGTIYRTDYKWN
jgi:hypothetical protein